MNRTTTFLAVAGILTLTALLVRPAPPAAPPAPPLLPAPSAISTTIGDGAVRLEARLAHPYFPLGTSEQFLVVDVQASASVPSSRRDPVRIALAIDRSGSMAGAKLEEAKRAARHLLSLLSERDRLSIIHYGSDVRRLPELPVTPGNREQMAAFIDAIHDEGGTNLSGGLEAAAAERSRSREADRSRRLILLSDGQPTEGLTDDAALFTLAARIREQGVAVSALGIGLDFNQALMQGLAQRGGGFYGYLRDASALADIFDRELDQATRAVARNPELVLTLPPGVRVIEVLGVPSSASGDTVRVPLYDLAAGASARVVVRLSVTAEAPSEHLPVAYLGLRYADARADGQVRDARALVMGTATGELAEVEGHADAQTLAVVNRALGAKQLATAAEEFRQGRRESAFALLDNVRALFGSSAEALAGDLRELDATRAAMSHAQSQDEVEDQARSLSRKNLSSFGMNNSY